MKRTFLTKKRISKRKTLFSKRKNEEYLYDSELYAPLGQIQNDNEEINFPDSSLIRKRKIIKKFFPEIPNQITKNYKPEDIIEILKKYKSNVLKSKLKKDMNYITDFEPESEENISNWRIDMLLANNKESYNLISKIILIVNENKISKRYDKNEILELLVFALGIDNLNEDIQKHFFEETNQFPEIIEYEKKINEIKNEDELKSLFNKNSENIKEFIKLRYIINIIKEPNENAKINPNTYRKQFFDYYLEFYKILNKYKETKDFEKKIKEFIDNNSKSDYLFNKVFPWDDTKFAFDLSNSIIYYKLNINFVIILLFYINILLFT